MITTSPGVFAQAFCFLAKSKRSAILEGEQKQRDRRSPLEVTTGLHGNSRISMADLQASPPPSLVTVHQHQ
ncbi:hypothetical protein AEAE_1187 [Aeriscardovia aeriphila]|uniref:Uncharacterized protein n=1 Tax=Aeriscardovia aeriphila TaxID=218139 RepID=A0A261F7T6_9BIFI|nr:hypothetical protein AEAE_1187 [Aeriscardovia aeriphila]